LDLFKDIDHPFYVIGVRERCKKSKIKHELAHALFYTDGDYKKKVLDILGKFDINKIMSELKERENYSDDVLLDEVHAWALCDSGMLEAKIPSELNIALNNIYEETIKKIK
jgi:hypothetical protein